MQSYKNTVRNDNNFTTLQTTDVVYVMSKKYVLEHFSRENKYTCISVFRCRNPYCYTCDCNEGAY